MLTIKNNIKTKDWDNFVKDHPNGNIFQTPEMYEVYKRSKDFEPVFLAVLRNDQIAGILLAVIQIEYKGDIFGISKRSIIRGGPLIKDDNIEVLDFILKAYNKEIRKKVVYSQYRNLWDWGKLKDVFKKNHYKYEQHLDIRIDLQQKEEDLWTNIKSNARNKIRKAEKSGVTFKVVENNDHIVDISFEILNGVYKHAKLPIADKSLFQNAHDVLKEKNMIRFFCAIKEGKIIGIRIGLIYKDMVYDWYAGSLFNYYKYNPNDFLPYNILVWGHKTGYKVFDFGGAGKPNEPYGVRDHKMKFGGELVEFGRFELIHKPKIMFLAKLGLKLYKKLK